MFSRIFTIAAVVSLAGATAHGQAHHQGSGVSALHYNNPLNQSNMSGGNNYNNPLYQSAGFGTGYNNPLYQSVGFGTGYNNPLYQGVGFGTGYNNPLYQSVGFGTGYNDPLAQGNGFANGFNTPFVSGGVSAASNVVNQNVGQRTTNSNRFSQMNNNSTAVGGLYAVSGGYGSGFNGFSPYNSFGSGFNGYGSNFNGFNNQGFGFTNQGFNNQMVQGNGLANGNGADGGLVAGSASNPVASATLSGLYHRSRPPVRKMTAAARRRNATRTH